MGVLYPFTETQAILKAITRSSMQFQTSLETVKNRLNDLSNAVQVLETLVHQRNPSLGSQVTLPAEFPLSSIDAFVEMEDRIKEANGARLLVSILLLENFVINIF